MGCLSCRWMDLIRALVDGLRCMAAMGSGGVSGTADGTQGLRCR